MGQSSTGVDMGIMASFDSRLLSALECPSCKEYMHPPIKQCDTGHSLCSTCHTAATRCPVCGSITSTSRSFTLENVHAKLIFPCRHRREGCHFVDFGNRIKQHEELCVYRPMPCPLHKVDDCAWVGTLKNITNHCKHQHPENFYMTNRQRLTCQNFIKHDGTIRSYFFIMFKAYGQLFKCAWDVNYKTGMMKWCVYHLGIKETARRYTYEIEIENQNFNEKLSISAPCEPLTDENKMLQNSQCTIMHYNVVRKFCDCHDLVYIVKIFDSGEF